MVSHDRMSASEAKAAIIGDHCHVAEGPKADPVNITTHLEKPDGLTAYAGGKTVLMPSVRNIDYMH